MNGMNIPNGMPTLSGGKHTKDSGKACMMEYISMLAGEGWTDYPACTDRVVASEVQWINDSMPDSQRHRLLPYISRIMGAAPYRDEEGLELEVAQAKCDISVPHFLAAVACTDQCCRTSEVRQRMMGDYLIERVEALLDTYDRVAGKQEYREVTETELRELAEAVKA